MVRADKDPILSQVCWGMTISEMPCDLDQSARPRRFDREHLLGLGADLYPASAVASEPIFVRHCNGSRQINEYRAIAKRLNSLAPSTPVFPVEFDRFHCAFSRPLSGREMLNRPEQRFRTGNNAAPSSALQQGRRLKCCRRHELHKFPGPPEFQELRR